MRRKRGNLDGLVGESSHIIALTKKFFKNVLFIQVKVFNFVIYLTTYG